MGYKYQVFVPMVLLRPTMSTPQALVEALLMKSILGEELIDAKFHLFSSRSAHTSKVTKLQALSANNVALTSRSEFFAELLSKEESFDATFTNFDRDSVFEDDMALDDYGYGSDSDLEDEEEEKASQTPASDETVVSEGELSESDDDDLLVVADARSEVDSPVDEPIQTTTPPKVAMSISTSCQHKPRVVDCRNILVRDTAFRTWKALILYLYTDKIVFSPLKSQRRPRVDVLAPDPSTLWPCSPKSMYRLACKVRLDGVRDQAFSAIRSSLNEENILQELSSSLTSKYPAILKMQVEVLFNHIASVPVIQNIPSLVKRIADSQLPHGADIIIDLFQKVMLKYHPQAMALASAPPDGERPPSMTSETPTLPLPLPPNLFGSPVAFTSVFSHTSPTPLSAHPVAEARPSCFFLGTSVFDMGSSLSTAPPLKRSSVNDGKKKTVNDGKKKTVNDGKKKKKK